MPLVLPPAVAPVIAPAVAPVIPVVLAALGILPAGFGGAAAAGAATGTTAAVVRTALATRDVVRAVPRAGWQAPLKGNPTIDRAFDPPAERWGRGHRGVDLPAAPMATVVAPANGVVVFAGKVGGKSSLSILHSNGVRTTYEPVLADVKVGQPVGRGASIGHLLPGPGHCAPRTCLHWGARKGTQYIDPLSLLKELSPILLPVR